MRKLVIEKAAVKHNLSVIKERAAGAVIYGVLTGDGGGAGVVPMAKILRAEGIGRFAIYDVKEAEKLRQAYTLFQAASEVARDTLEVNLRAIEQIQARQAGDSAQAEEERKNHQTDFRA